MEGRGGLLQPIQYPLDELKKATHDFSHANKLGSGGSGVVYKGMLNGMMVAVKKLQHGSSAERLFDVAKEVSLLCSLKHDNLVKLLGFCSEAGNYLLVYEYIQNGNLGSYLNDESKRKELTWEKRFNIIEGIAKGLVYLHVLEDPIIHRDLKPVNLLLDENHNVKIADFGLSKSFNKNKTHHTTRIVRGTPGYVAPELLIVQRYSPKSDVYNFGLIILEIIAGCTIDQYPSINSGAFLQHDVWSKWKKKSSCKRVIDPFIWDKGQNDHIKRCIEIGLLCIQHDHKKRPHMKDVLEMLTTNNSLSAPDYPGFLQQVLTGSSSRVEESSNHLEPQRTEDEATRTQLDSRGHIDEHADSIPTDPSISNDFNQTMQAKQYSLLDIMIATNKFSIQVWNQSLYQYFYKGVLDGQEVVVQKYFTDIRELLKIISFVKEGSRRNSLPPNTRHPIVNILGYCWDEPEKRLYLVLEYPRKGLTLNAYLLDDDCPNREWSTYKRIINGIANAICYLHHSSRQKYLVHGFLNPFSIWLDDSWNVQLSNFYSIKVKDRDEAFSEIPLPCGRLGYITRDENISDDAYRFGFILLRILVGKIYEVWKQWDSKKDMLELLDPRIKNYSSDEARCYFEIVLLCLQPEPELRPNMVEVVKMLNSHVALPIRSRKHRRS